ncbi:hypothetical protein GCM10020367_54720 [Streptomyces sannanensis]|uniref:Uncharacterized protein n=1 Tax=Streptomyces sannanensis TaxID=285536 RepID=A0ABP6SIH5_9ACTN
MTVQVLTSKVCPGESVGVTVTEVPPTDTFRKWWTCASSAGTGAPPVPAYRVPIATSTPSHIAVRAGSAAASGGCCRSASMTRHLAFRRQRPDLLHGCVVAVVDEEDLRAERRDRGPEPTEQQGHVLLRFVNLSGQ